LGVDEIVIMSTASFATVWFYSEQTDLSFDLSAIGLSNPDITVQRDLKAAPFYLRNGNEALKIDGTVYVQYKFSRESKFYI
jgi:hypothetical protein